MSMGVVKKSVLISFALASFVLYQNCAPIEGNKESGSQTFNAAAAYQRVQGIFNTNCTTCHATGDSSNRNVGLASWADIIGSGVLVAGNSEISRLYQVVNDGTMPRNSARLSDNDVAAIRDWIDMGAPDSDGNASNDVPVINIVGGDKTGREGGPQIEFFAIVTDQDGAVLSTIWTQTSGPNNATLAGAQTNRLLVSGYVAGTYTFQLLAEDDQRAISTATVTLTIDVSPNVDPTITLASSSTREETVPSDDVTASVDDPDGNNANITYLWIIGAGTNGDTATLQNADQRTVTVTNYEANGMSSNTYPLTLTITDERGGTATAAHNFIVSSPANMPPTATIAPTSDDIVVGSNHSVSVTASDPEGANLSYSWAINPTGPTIAGGNTANATFSNFSSTSTGLDNQYTITVTVSDGTDSVTASQTLTVYAYSYSASVQPIFDANCTGCHGAAMAGTLDLRSGTSHGALVNQPANNNAAGSTYDRVEPRDSASSELWVRVGVLPASDALSMPQNQAILSSGDRAIIQTWIEDGAPNN